MLVVDFRKCWGLLRSPPTYAKGSAVRLVLIFCRLAVSAANPNKTKEL